MRKFFITALMAIFLSVPLSHAAENASVKPKIELTAEEKDDELVQRLLEIQEMDMKDMSRAEKKALKKEVKAIENRLGIDNRISISVGALIIIILLIILLT